MGNESSRPTQQRQPIIKSESEKTAEKAKNEAKQISNARKVAIPAAKQISDAQKLAIPAAKRITNARKVAIPTANQISDAQEVAIPAANQITNARKVAIPAAKQIIDAQKLAIPAAKQISDDADKLAKITNDIQTDISNGINDMMSLNAESANIAAEADAIAAAEAQVNLSNSNTFSNIKEGFTENFDIMKYITFKKQHVTDRKKELQHDINDIKKDQGLEFGALRNDIMGNLLMDYMINEEEGTNIEKVYNKLNQKKNDELRKIQITNYYTKSYKEYIHLLKIILVAIAIIIPILIFNRIELISKDITLLTITSIILLTSLYCIYKIYLLYMKDPIDFDKIKIPYDRQMKKLVDDKSNNINYKDSPFKAMNVTCIGEECCDGSMVYDNLKNKCIMQENFHNYFENAMQIKNSNKSIIQQSDLPENKKTFTCLAGNSNIKEPFSANSRFNTLMNHYLTA